MLNEKWYCGVLALFLVCAAAAEEETPKPSLLRRIQDVAEDRNEATPIGIQHCFLIVKGKNGSGSAFLAEFQGQTTIVSNAHVMLEIREPKIFDVDGREYEITEVVGSKSRDLVLAGFKAPAGQKPTPLKIAENVSAMPVGTPLTAYGNSGGASVITTLRGTLQASGPDSIEITCGIIGGNSGGPVLGKDDRVVGVSTYAQLLPYDVFAAGSRFAGEWYEVVIRRFATRLDNLSVDDLEEINLKNLETEQNFIEKIERWEEDLLDVFRKNRNVTEAKLMAAIRQHCIKFGGLLEESGTLQ